MSDPAAADRAEGAAGRLPALTPAAVEAVLADFRAWLLDLAQRSEVRDQRSGEAGRSSLTSDLRPLTSQVDLFTLVGQFTALRHEVNLQTKAARAATEQSAEVLKQVTAPRPDPAADPDELRAAAKAVVDIADALALSLRQAEKLRDHAAELLAVAENRGADTPRPPRPGFFARLVGGRPPAPPAPAAEPVALDHIRRLAAGVADGYALSLRRVERVLPTLELEARPCYGGPFDPDWMEAVEVVGDTGEPAGTVVEEVRPGYLWRGKPFRPAQVKVAR